MSETTTEIVSDKPSKDQTSHLKRVHDQATKSSFSFNFGDIRNRYKAVLPYVRRGIFGAKNPQERRMMRNSAFIGADGVMQELKPIIEKGKIDSKTKLNTNETFEELLLAEAEIAKTTGEKLIVLFVDLNNFKPINDKLTHEVGDIVLAEFGDLVRRNIRPADVAGRIQEDSKNSEVDGHAGRFGGDEFMFLLKDTDLKGAASFFERLSLGLHSLPIYNKLAENGVPVSMSAGAVEVDLSDPISSIKMADEEMYRAKLISHANPNSNQLSTKEQQLIT